MKFLGGKNSALAVVGKRQVLAKRNAPKGEKASFVIKCSRDQNRGTEYLLLVINGKQYVGAKRVTALDGGTQKSASNSSLQIAGLQFKNGLNKTCSVCSNATYGGCPACGAFSCFTEGQPQTCPECGLHLKTPFFGTKYGDLLGSKNSAPSGANTRQGKPLPSTSSRLKITKNGK